MKRYRVNDMTFGFSSRSDAFGDSGNSHPVDFNYLHIHVRLHVLIPVDVTLKLRIIKPSGKKMTSKTAPEGCAGVFIQHFSGFCKNMRYAMWFGRESSSCFTETGRWTVELLDEDDNLLISKQFVLTHHPAENYMTVRSITLHPLSDMQRLAVEYSENHKLSQPKVYSTDGHDWLVSVDLLRTDPNDYDVDVYVNLWFPDNDKMTLLVQPIESRYDAVANWGVKLDPDLPVPKGQWHMALHLRKPDGDDVLLKTQMIRMY